MNANRAYARATQETASKERLMVLLFETALRHMRHGATLLEQKQTMPALTVLNKASNIVTELAATLDTKAAPELADSLGQSYTFVAERIAFACVSLDPTPAHQAARVFAPIVEGFQQAVASLGATP